MATSLAVPIAVVGIGCRFPGGVDSAETFWQMLAQGRDVVTEVPPERWDVRSVYDPEPGVPGKTQSRWGAFLDDVSGFEPEFFGLTDRESALIDPQFRLLLETSCEALEHAGLAPHGLRGSATAVMVGCSYEDYMDMMDFDRGLRSPDAAHAIIGTTRFTASSRIAYLLDLRGPAVTLDTACSSALVAVHLAAQSLRSGEADLALAGGVMLSLQAKNTLVFSTLGVLSPQGRCRAFSADGNGYVRGEGCGMVALKRLPDALAEGNRVLAVLRETGANNNGRSDTMLSPSVEGQQALQEQVLGRSGTDPARVALVETHGPGTEVGDPIEYAALRAAYGAAGAPCALGSVKTNIGHCETASGVAGLIKAVLAVQHGRIPANLHFAAWNPEIQADKSRFYVPTRLTPWPDVEGPRIAAVSSYGMSGTNAHVLVEQAPEAVRPTARGVSDTVRLYPLSAGSEQALATTAGRLAQWLEAGGTGRALRDVAHTLACRREHRTTRAVVAARDRAELVQGLRRLAAGKVGARVWTGTARRQSRGPVWVFSGQGSQWAGMGRALLAGEPAFAAVVKELEPVVRAESGFSVREALAADAVVTGFATVQPTLFTMQVALAAAWRAHGVEPAAVIGHSVGEAAAAVVAGALSPADGAMVVCRRSRLLARLAGTGAMAQVMLPHREVEAELLATASTGVSIAAVSSPSATVVSGDAQQVEALVTAWQRRDVMAGLVAVDVASHSAQVEPVLPELRACVSGIAPRAARVGFYSTVLDDPRATPAFEADYWADNLRLPVRFTAACDAALADGHRSFIEISPHPLLTHFVEEIAIGAGRQAIVLPTLIRGQADPAGLLAQAATAYCAGVAMSWPRHTDGDLAEVPLPVWARRSLWMPESITRREEVGQIGRPLLGADVVLPDGLDTQHVWQADVGTAAYPWLADHRVYGAPAMPGAGFAEMVLAAATDLYGEAARFEVRGLVFHSLLTLNAHTVLTTRATCLTPHSAAVEILSEEGGQAQRLATATVHRLNAGTGAEDACAQLPFDLAAALARQQPAASPEPVFANARSKGVQHGPGFVGLTATYQPAALAQRVIGRIQIPRQLRGSARTFRAHPVLLDACMQVLCSHPALMAPASAYLPLSIGTLRGHDMQRASWCVADLREADDAGARADLTLLAEDGTIVAELLDTRLGRSQAEDAVTRAGQRMLAVEWDATPPPPLADAATDSWLVITEDGHRADPLTESLVTTLGAAGTHCTHRVVGPEESATCAVETLLSCQDDQGLVVLCPPPASDESTEGIKRARDRVRHLIRLVRILSDTTAAAPPRLYVVTRGAQAAPGTERITLEQAPLRGLCRVIGSEHPALRTTHIDVAGDTCDATDLVAELLADDAEDETAWRAGIRYVARLRSAPFQDGERHTTTARFGQDGVAPVPRRRGDLDSLELVTRPRRAPGEGEIEIGVHTAGLNFKDVLNALGTLADTTDATGLGLDCAGEVTAVGPGVADLRIGDRVTAFAPGALGSFVTVPTTTVFPIPATMTYPEAVTLPTVYLTAWYALHHLARVQPEEHVLIHSATGGLGRAALALARAAGATVHATAGTEAKRDQLRAMGIAHVHDSRTLDFAEQIRSATGGRGVDIVLNSLTGSALRAGLDLLRPSGRFIELGKRDIHANHRLGLEPFARNITFASVDLTLIAEELPRLAETLTREVAAEVAAGRIHPLPHTIHPLSHLGDALRTMAGAQHTGKLVITIPRDGTSPAVIPPSQVRLADCHGAYIITGGLGGLGLLLARDLAEHGAGRIVLNGRGHPGEHAAEVIGELRRSGSDIDLQLGDITDPATARRLVDTACATGLPLRGIAHAAAVVADATVANIDDDLLDRVWGAKTTGAWHLSQASRGQPLDWWLGFSSATALMGNPGQGAYAAANAWLDALTHHRRSQGLPAHSIQWGAWADHGRGTALADRGFTMIGPAEGLAACRTILSHNRACTGYLPIPDARRFIGDRLHTLPFFTPLAHQDRAADATDAAEHTALRATLAAAEAQQRSTLLSTFLAEQTAAILRRHSTTVDPDVPLADCGLDSLMALELSTRINKALGIQVPPKAIWKHSTVTALAAHLAHRFAATAEASPDPEHPSDGPV
ncbi:SDR family NAD(P)-dependent oxidoreductase [Streptomyces syringium]|uniref:SDR family NAD(P)-dependent oxidoreductase n=1 Tax=Streptomyces syringium TaxID=76729 RepID=UPI0033B04B92